MKMQTITITEAEAKEHLYKLYPSWHRRWGWTEANKEMKNACWHAALEAKLPSSGLSIGSTYELPMT